jgi:hypothetical protein
MPQQREKGEAAQQHRSLTNYEKGKTAQTGPLRTTISPQSPLIEEARRHGP